MSDRRNESEDPRPHLIEKIKTIVNGSRQTSFVKVDGLQTGAIHFLTKYLRRELCMIG